MSRNARDYSAQAGSPTMTTEFSPKTKVMEQSFLSFTAKEYRQLVKR